jgi:hypothetical protein
MIKNQDAHFKGSEMAPPTLRSQKAFFKNVAIGAQSLFKFAATPQRRPAGYAVHGFWRCGLFATVDATQTQRRTFVSRCVGMEVDKFYATPEALKNMGVAALRIFWRVNGNFFCLEIQKLG